MTQLEQAKENIRRWRESPAAFVREQFGVEPDAWQLEVLSEFPRRRRMALLACKGPGKTAVLAWLAWNFLATRPHPKLAATSITSDNLADGLWTEMAKWQAKSPFLKAAFTWTKTRIFSNDHPETWFLSSRTWSKSADTSQQADTLAGLHADYLLFILDEVGGIPDAVMAAAEAGLATGKDTKIIMAGNPTHLEGPLYRAASTEAHLWYVKRITADPAAPDRTPRVSIEWANEQIEKYGRDNPWVLVNVFGKFPPSSLNTLLGPDEVQAAMKRAPREENFSFSQKRIGVDVARFGDDRTVIFKRQGLMSYPPIILRNERTTDIAARVMLEKKAWQSEMEFVDDSGHWGHGVIDNLFAAGFSPTAVLFEGKATDPRYKNKRAEMWLEMAEWVKRGGALPNVPELVRELTAPTYTFVNGVFVLEPKDDIKERLGTSPDLADALCLTFFLPEMPASMGAYGTTRTKVETDYDPFARSS
jgi:phage terminase large subunit